MVLEEVGGDNDGFDGGNGPQSEYQDFSSGTTFTVDLDKLPKPVPIVGWLVGYGPTARRVRLEQAVTQTAALFPRPLRENEVNAILESYSQIMATASWGDTIGMALGGLQSYRKAQTFRFPFWQPNMEKFTPESIGPFRGSMARMIWHCMRTAPYMTLGAFVGDMLFRNSATVNTIYRMKHDERLRDFNKILEGVMVKKIEDVSRRRQERAGRSPPLQKSDEPEGRLQSQTRRRQDESDDMSPTGGAFLDDYAAGSDPRASQSRRLDRQDAQQRDTGGYDRYDGQSYDERDTRRPPPVRSRDSDGAYAFDLSTSSNVEPGSSQTPLPPWAGNRNAGRISPQGSESSWDRLRRRAQDGSSSGSSSNYGSSESGQRTRSAGSDSFSFSSADEERQLAKPEAQKEFDRRLERERRGKDF